jgi:hypothetical protein
MNKGLIPRENVIGLSQGNAKEFGILSRGNLQILNSPL